MHKHTKYSLTTTALAVHAHWPRRTCTYMYEIMTITNYECKRKLSNITAIYNTCMWYVVAKIIEVSNSTV